MSKLALLSNIERAMNGLWDKAISLFATKGEVAKKADKVHNHDDRYYTESEMNTKLSGKADASHNHDDKYFKFAYLGNVADFNTAKNEGKYVVSKDSDIPNAPYKGALYGTLVVFHRNGGEAIQNFISSDGRNIWVRHWNNSSSAFGTWVKLSIDGHDHNNLYYTRTEMNSKLDSKANTSHNHDNLYYTESEMNTKLAAKADTTHNHDTAYYKRAEVDSKLDGKANASHNHDSLYFKKAPVRLAGSEDLNTITTPDNYVVASASIKNAPKQYGRMVVLGWSDANKWVTQIFYADVSNEMYVRCSTNATATTWTPWAKMFSSTFKPTWNEIDGKPSSFIPATHNHDNLYYTESEMNTKLAAKADTTHNHDTAYYKRAEVDSKLGGKADISHGHNYLPSGVTITKEGDDFYINY